MLYLLDTNICIYITKNRPPEVRDRFLRLRPGQVGMSTITYGELLFGAEKSQQATRVRARLQQLCTLVPVLPLTMETGMAYAAARAKLEQRGTPIGANDLWIAAHALTEKLILVTNNEREFRRVPGLSVENWIRASG